VLRRASSVGPMLDLLANVFSLESFATYWGIGLLFFAAEYWWPTRPVSYRQVFLSDVAAFTTYQIFLPSPSCPPTEFRFRPIHIGAGWHSRLVSGWSYFCSFSMGSPIGCIVYGIPRGSGPFTDGTMPQLSCIGSLEFGQVFLK